MHSLQALSISSLSELHRSVTSVAGGSNKRHVKSSFTSTQLDHTGSSNQQGGNVQQSSNSCYLSNRKLPQWQCDIHLILLFSAQLTKARGSQGLAFPESNIIIKMVKACEQSCVVEGAYTHIASRRC